ncbi:MAG TPA: hypothetical protein VFX60_07390, partial [Micromonospora sp.]|nr:hypothetical protein [Micromonospora sp.]
TTMATDARHRFGLSDPASRNRRCRPPRLAGRAVGVYRLWRDTGFVAGSLLAGIVADLAGLRAAIWVVAGSNPPRVPW